MSLVAIADCTFPSIEIEQSILEAAQRCRKAAYMAGERTRVSLP